MVNSGAHTSHRSKGTLTVGMEPQQEADGMMYLEQLLTFQAGYQGVTVHL